MFCKTDLFSVLTPRAEYNFSPDNVEQFFALWNDEKMQ